MQLHYFAIDEIKEYENNPRINDGAVEAVANSIKEFGFKVPIVVDEDNVIIAGHTRYKAALKLNLERVPCIVASDLLPEQARAYRLADNKVSELAEWDFNALAKELGDLNLDMQKFGFEVEDFNLDEFGEEFNLADGEKGELEQITFTLHNEQADLIRHALSVVEECTETFGNTNKNGNSLFEVVKQWVELKK